MALLPFSMPRVPKVSVPRVSMPRVTVPSAPKWMANRIAKLRGENKSEEVKMLRPIALAGACRGFQGRSELCNTVATHQCPNDARKLSSPTQDNCAGTPTDDGPSPSKDRMDMDGWKACKSCNRTFLCRASKFEDFCSIDCRTAYWSRDHYYQQQ